MSSTVIQRIDSRVRSYISNPTIQQSIVLMGATTAANVLQYVFHAFVSRALGPTDYGVLTSLLALYLIVSVPAGIAQTVITQYVARFRALAEPGRIAGLFGDGVRYLSAAGIVIFVVVAVLSQPIASFLNVADAVPVIAMASVFIVSGGSTAVIGSLQGLQRFYVISATGFLTALFRLAAAIAFILVGWGAAGALGATTVATLLAALVGLFFLRDVMATRAEEHGLALGVVSRYTLIVLVGTLAFTVLTNVDLIVVKHYFSPEEAGYYSAAATLGKIILFFPGAISTVMFPKTSHRFALGQTASDLARQSLWAIVALCGAAAIVLAIFPTLAVHILFGTEFDASIGLVGLYGATMGLYALVQMLMAFYISQEEGRFVWLMAAVTAALAVGLVLFHGSLVQVILSLAVSALGVLVISEVWLGGLGLVPRQAALK